MRDVRACRLPFGKNNSGIVRKSGVDVNALEKNDETVLMHAVSENAVDMTRLLMESGAGIGAKNNKGKTALMLAEERDASALSPPSVRLLLLLRVHLKDFARLLFVRARLRILRDFPHRAFRAREFSRAVDVKPNRAHGGIL